RGIYYVGGVFGNSIQLFSSLADALSGSNAVELSSLGIGSQHRLDRQLALAPDKADAGLDTIHTLILTSDLPIANLQDGVTYYVELDTISPNDRSDRFQLRDRNGDLVNLDASGLSATAVHTLGTEGIDLTSSSGEHR